MRQEKMHEKREGGACMSETVCKTLERRPLTADNHLIVNFFQLQSESSGHVTGAVLFPSCQKSSELPIDEKTC